MQCLSQSCLLAASAVTHVVCPWHSSNKVVLPAMAGCAARLGLQVEVWVPEAGSILLKGRAGVPCSRRTTTISLQHETAEECTLMLRELVGRAKKAQAEHLHWCNEQLCITHAPERASQLLRNLRARDKGTI